MESRIAGFSVYLIFNGNGGTNVPGKAEIVSVTGWEQYGWNWGVQIPQSPIPTRTGYDFLGWSYDPNSSTGDYPPGQYLFYSSVSSDINIYAIWSPTYYTITYNDNNTNTTTTKSIQYGSSGLISNPGFSKEGYSFLGWNTSFSAISALSSYTVTKNDTLYAIWKANTYNINYMDIEDLPYSGNNLDSLTKSFVYNVETELIDGQKELYDFKGWYLDSKGKKGPITSIPANTYTDDLILYALFSPKSNSYIYSTINGISKYRLSIPYIYKDGKWQKILSNIYQNGWKR